MRKDIAKLLIELRILRKFAWDKAVKAREAEAAFREADSVAGEASKRIITALNTDKNKPLNKLVMLPDGTLATIQDHYISFTDPDKIEKLK